MCATAQLPPRGKQAAAAAAAATTGLAQSDPSRSPQHTCFHCVGPVAACTQWEAVRSVGSGGANTSLVGQGQQGAGWRLANGGKARVVVSPGKVWTGPACTRPKHKAASAASCRASRMV